MLTACAGVAPPGSPQTPSATPAVPSTSPSPTASALESAGDPIGDILKAHSFSGAALVARGDEVLYRGAMGLADVASKRPNTPETRFKAASVHKQLRRRLALPGHR
jgi:CubicO group peptidase (beta-lactamase class C family)